jgi:hypothetical protein
VPSPDFLDPPPALPPLSSLLGSAVCEGVLPVLRLPLPPLPSVGVVVGVDDGGGVLVENVVESLVDCGHTLALLSHRAPSLHAKFRGANHGQVKSSHTEDELLVEVVDVSDVEEEVEEEEEEEDQAEVEVAMEVEDVDAEVEAVLCTTVLVTLTVMITILGGCQGCLSSSHRFFRDNKAGVFGQRRGSTQGWPGSQEILFLQVAVGLSHHGFRDGINLQQKTGSKMQESGASQEDHHRRTSVGVDVEAGAVLVPDGATSLRAR